MVQLTVGSHRDDATSEVVLSAHKFNRHTFWCGQSGSGKTYALGVVLEQLLLNTRLPLLILDPNADFTRLPETRDTTDPTSPRPSKNPTSGYCTRPDATCPPSCGRGSPNYR